MLEEHEARIQSLAEEMEVTRSNCQSLGQENLDLKDELESLQDKKELLILEVSCSRGRGCGDIVGYDTVGEAE